MIMKLKTEAKAQGGCRASEKKEILGLKKQETVADRK
jgi:hypothetical protein